MNMKRIAIVMIASLLVHTGIKVQANCNACEDEVAKAVIVPTTLSYATKTRHPQTILYDVEQLFLKYQMRNKRKCLS